MANLRRYGLFVALVVGWTALKPAWPAAEGAVLRIVPEDDSWRCPCNHAHLDTLVYPPCSLCWEAEMQPADVSFFFVRDIDPRKPNRWLILPKTHTNGMQHLSDLSAAASGSFWTAAIAKAQALWGDKWGLAVNGDEGRTQCHAHVHIGKLLDGTENADFLVKAGWSRGPGKAPLTLKGAEEIRAPSKGEAFWIHPSGGGLHMHVQDASASAEFVLMR